MELCDDIFREYTDHIHCFSSIQRLQTYRQVDPPYSSSVRNHEKQNEEHQIPVPLDLITNTYHFVSRLVGTNQCSAMCVYCARDDDDDEVTLPAMLPMPTKTAIVCHSTFQAFPTKLLEPMPPVWFLWMVVSNEIVPVVSRKLLKYFYIWFHNIVTEGLLLESVFTHSYSNYFHLVFHLVPLNY